MVARIFVCLGCAACLMFAAAGEPPARTSPTQSTNEALQESPSEPPTLRLPAPPSLKLPPVESVPDAEAQIRRTLGKEGEGKAEQSPTSADPVLQDVLEMIRKNGSILDGSLLDEVSQADSQAPQASGRRETDGHQRNQVIALAVEDLLRTARILEAMPSDPIPASTIQNIRHIASELLTQLIENPAP